MIGAFLGIFKAFHKKRDHGLSYKLRAYSIQDEILSFLRNHLQMHKQGVALNGRTLETEEIISGVPQEMV